MHAAGGGFAASMPREGMAGDASPPP